jgi:hypothetical protein
MVGGVARGVPWRKGGKEREFRARDQDRAGGRACVVCRVTECGQGSNKLGATMGQVAAWPESTRDSNH